MIFKIWFDMIYQKKVGHRLQRGLLCVYQLDEKAADRASDAGDMRTCSCSLCREQNAPMSLNQIFSSSDLLATGLMGRFLQVLHSAALLPGWTVCVRFPAVQTGLSPPPQGSQRITLRLSGRPTFGTLFHWNMRCTFSLF